jgi:hypothetical protein
MTEGRARGRGSLLKFQEVLVHARSAEHQVAGPSRPQDTRQHEWRRHEMPNVTLPPAVAETLAMLWSPLLAVTSHHEGRSNGLVAATGVFASLEVG